MRLSQALFLATVASTFLVLSGCDGEALKTTAKTTNTTITTSDPLVGVVDDNAGFYVRIRDNGKKFTYAIHDNQVGATFDSGCKITSSSSVKDILCIVEGKEYDLHFFGADLQYNLPSSMCTYFEFRPYYYFAYRPGTAAGTTVAYDVDSTGAIVAPNSGNPGAGAPTITGSVHLTGDNVVCDYDYTESDGPNCCTGDYTKTVRTWDAANNKYGDPVISSGKFTGKAGNCLRGPAIDTQAKDKDGYPKFDSFYVESTGLNKEYVIPTSIGKVAFGVNVYIANFFDPADHTGTLGYPGYYTTIPKAFDSQNGAIDDAFPFYEFSCLDRNREYNARITLMIREWNTASEFAKGLLPPAADPDASGAEGFVGDKNDFVDWKDYGDQYPGSSVY